MERQAIQVRTELLLKISLKRTT